MQIEYIIKFKIEEIIFDKTLKKLTKLSILSNQILYFVQFVGE